MDQQSQGDKGTNIYRAVAEAQCLASQMYMELVQGQGRASTKDQSLQTTKQWTQMPQL